MQQLQHKKQTNNQNKTTTNTIHHTNIQHWNDNDKQNIIDESFVYTIWGFGKIDIQRNIKEYDDSQRYKYQRVIIYMNVVKASRQYKSEL
jgi:hypothetical protein